MLLTSAAGNPLLALVYGPEYASYGTLLVLIMVSAAISYLASVCGFALTAMRVFRPQPLILSATVASCAASCWVLIPRAQLYGAAWSAVIAASVYLLLTAGVLSWIVRDVWSQTSHNRGGS